MNIISKKFTIDSKTKNISIISIFNELPSKSNIEDISKIYKKYESRIQLFSIFCKRFKLDSKINFPHIFQDNLVIESIYNKKKLEKNYFILLKKDRIFYVEKDFDLKYVNFLLQKKINPDLDYKNYVISNNELEKFIKNKFKKGSFLLLNLYSNKMEEVSNLTLYKKIVFIHAECSWCKLKNLLSQMKMKQIFKSEKISIVFSVYGNSFELKSLADENKINIPIYIDINDNFDLMSKITDGQSDYIEINSNEIF